MIFGELDNGSRFKFTEVPAQGAVGMMEYILEKVCDTHARIVGIVGGANPDSKKYIGEHRHVGVKNLVALV